MPEVREGDWVGEEAVVVSASPAEEAVCYEGRRPLHSKELSTEPQR